MDSRAALAVSSAIAAEGDTIVIRVPDIHSSNLCTTGFKEIRAVVKKTTAHATIAQDVASPSTGFSASDFTEIGAEFESLIYPTDTLYFGKESDRNADGPCDDPVHARGESRHGERRGWLRRRLLLAGRSREEDRSTSSSGLQCPQTNEQEVFYMLVPDPGWLRSTRIRASVATVRQNTRGTIAHEFQHMINQGRRLPEPRGGQRRDDLVERSALALRRGDCRPREAWVRRLPEADVCRRESRPVERGRLPGVLPAEPPPVSQLDGAADTSSPTSNLTASQLAPRGAAWMLLRYSGDFYSGGNLKAFLRKVVGGPDFGLRNLLQHSNVQFDDMLSGWLISQFTTDLNIANLPSAYQMKSWAVRDAMTGASQGTFPLLVTPLPTIVDTKSISGSGNYFRLTRTTSSPETTFRMQGTSGGMVGFTGARVYVVRIN
jgi:hypothetical protein